MDKFNLIIPEYKFLMKLIDILLIVKNKTPSGKKKYQIVQIYLTEY